LELEKLRFQIAQLKRMKFGRSSEALDRELTRMQLSDRCSCASSFWIFFAMALRTASAPRPAKAGRS
jgi:hypothetical protein